MMSIHEKSIFGGYKCLEDQATAALLHILDIVGPHMVEYVFEDALSSSDMDGYLISAQTYHVTSRPDGEILADYHLFIESKIDTWDINKKHNEKQLENHLKNAENSNAILIYILNQTDIPKSISNKCFYTTWDEVIKRLRDFVEQRTYFNKELMNYLIAQLDLLVRSKPQKRTSWKDIPQTQRVVIVGGSWGEDVALNYGFYACQYNRKFQSPSYIAFYHQKRIKYVFRIKRQAKLKNLHDAENKLGFVFKDYFTRKDIEYDKKSPKDKTRQFFELVEMQELSPIIHEKAYAYARNQRYTSIAAILKAKTTKELQ